MKNKGIKKVLITTLLLACSMLAGTNNVIQSTPEVNLSVLEKEKGSITLPIMRVAENIEAIKSSGIILGSDIVLNAYVDGYQAEEVEMLFTLQNGDLEIASSKVKGEMTENGLRFSFKGVTPQYLNLQVKMDLITLSNNEIVSTKKQSVKEYCMNVLSLSEYEGYTTNKLRALKTVAVDLLNYGAAAQNYTEKNTSDLANKDLTEEQKTLASSFDTPKNKLNLPNQAEKTVTWKGARLWFNSKVGVGLVFSINEEIAKDSITVDIDGNIISEFTEVTINGETCYEARYNDISALDFNKDIKALVKVNEEVASVELNYSVNSYSSNASEKMKELAQATYCYGKGANLFKAADELANTDSYFITKGDTIVVGKEYNDYIFDKFVFNKETVQYRYDNNQYYIFDENQETIVKVNRSLTLNDYTMDAYNLNENVAYNPLTDVFTISLTESQEEGSLNITVHSEGDVVLDIKNDVTYKNLSFKNGFRTLTIKGAGTLTLTDTFASEASRTVIDGKLLINKNTTESDAMVISNGKLVVLETGSLEIKSASGERINGKSGMFITGLESYGKINISGIMQGVFAQGNSELDIRNGNFNISNCKNALSTSASPLNVYGGVINFEADDNAVDTGNLNIINGNVTFTTKSTEDVARVTSLNIGSETTKPLLTINANGGGAVTNKTPSDTRLSNHHLISGTVNLKQNKVGENVGISFNHTEDNMVVEKDATLIINDFARSLSGWNEAIGTISFTSRGNLEMKSTQSAIYDITTIELLEGTANITANSGTGIYNCDNFKLGTETTRAIFNLSTNNGWGMEIKSDNVADYQFINGVANIRNVAENRGYAALQFDRGFAKLLFAKDVVYGSCNYSFVIRNSSGTNEKEDVTFDGKCYYFAKESMFPTDGIDGSVPNYLDNNQFFAECATIDDYNSHFQN